MFHAPIDTMMMFKKSNKGENSFLKLEASLVLLLLFFMDTAVN